VLLLNECLLLFISLSTQSGKFWIHTRIWVIISQKYMKSIVPKNSAVKVCKVDEDKVYHSRTRLRVPAVFYLDMLGIRG
jgi:hypothetical protein